MMKINSVSSLLALKHYVAVTGFAICFSLSLAPEASAVELSSETPSDDSTEAEVQASEKKDKPNFAGSWEGSMIQYRNEVSVLSFDRDAELTYNPYYAMELRIDPRWNYGRYLYITAKFKLVQEITDSDQTTMKREPVLDDFKIEIGAKNIITIPVLDIGITPTLGFIAPTSKKSQASTLILGTTLGLTLSRRFQVLSGLSLIYGVYGAKYFHQYTTAQFAAPVVPCSGADCEAYLNTGRRNNSWRVTNAFMASIDFTSYIGLGIGAFVVNDFLYPSEDSDDVSYEPQTPSNRRDYFIFEIDLHGKPIPSFDSFIVKIGATGFNPQLSPDSTYYTPFFNRYTMFFLDLRLELNLASSGKSPQARRKNDF